MCCLYMSEYVCASTVMALDILAFEYGKDTLDKDLLFIDT